MIYEPPPDVDSDMQKQGQLSTPQQLSTETLCVVYMCVCVCESQ